MKYNIYLLVFGIIAAIIVVAALSTLVFNQKQSGSHSSANLSNLSDYGPAPQISGISYWINGKPMNLTGLRGKVVLIDFWTYSCINCIRTIPHLNALEKEYGNSGLVIIGVHTPEFDFEKNYTNVLNAVHRFNITYPVAMDNNYSTWIAYNNHYWPADYIIDKNGNIRSEQFGEGDYNNTEQIIRTLLVQAGYAVPSQLTNSSLGVNFSGIGSPEMYFGYEEILSGRTNYFGNPSGLMPNETFNYTFTNVSRPNAVYLEGEWYCASDSIISRNTSEIFLLYEAKSVNVVASGNGNGTGVSVFLDGKNLNSSYLGSDDHVSNGTAVANVSSSRLYNIIDAPSYGVHLLEIKANRSFRIYTFTFG